MEKEIKVVIVEPRKRSCSRTINNDYKALQEVVGGYAENLAIKIPDIKSRLVIIFNEDGRAKRLPLNRKVQGHHIVGTFLVCKQSGDELVSLGTTDVKKIMEYMG